MMRGQAQSGASVVVVGAGISGCACAATLSACDVPVTVIGNALDIVGRPGYGPVVEGGDGGWNRIIATLESLPSALRSVWLEASSACDVEAPFFFVDRRMLSIETKRALEEMPGLQFRQGLVNEVRCLLQEASADGARPDGGRRGDRRPFVLGTAFGETIEADVVVFAVGMSLGGRVQVGDEVVPGGRYGETLAEGLGVALEALGAVFVEKSIQVGPCFRGRGADGTARMEATVVRSRGRGRVFGGRRVGVVPLRERLEAEKGCSLTAATPLVAWPEGYPPASHWEIGLRPRAAFLAGGGKDTVQPWLSPDGRALGEIHCGPFEPESACLPWESCGHEHYRGGKGRGSDEPGDDWGEMPVASRLGCVVSGQVVENIDWSGRLLVEGRWTLPLWVCGRAGGAVDYLGSLESGVRTGREVARVVSLLSRAK